MGNTNGEQQPGPERVNKGKGPTQFSNSPPGLLPLLPSLTPSKKLMEIWVL